MKKNQILLLIQYAGLITLAVLFITCKEQRKPQIKYEPTLESLGQHQCPEWFRDAKFGIFMHWGVMSVVEGNSGWYGRHMYMQVNNEWGQDYQKHLERYEHPSESGYKDLIPLWKARKWNPDKIVKLYKEIGARYIVPVAVHHDNFDLFNSSYQPWNSVNMGPKRDVIGEWAEAAKKYGLRFGVSSHNDRSWTWLEPAFGSDVSGPMKGVKYDGWDTKEDGKGLWWEGYDPADLYTTPHDSSATFTKEYCEKWYNRTIELIDKYHPDLIYFDGPLPIMGTTEACAKSRSWTKEYGLRMAAHYFNENPTWNNGKNDAVIAIKEWKGFPIPNKKAFTADFEKSGNTDTQKFPWQTDTSLSGTWFWNGNPHNEISDTVIIHNLCDVVSKNGNYLLNVGLTADGEIPEYEMTSLENIGAWLKVNGEAIFDTRPWEKFGEGPSIVPEGEFQQNKKPFTSEDIRFTKKQDALYAIFMDWPKNNVVNIKSLSKALYGETPIISIEVLGSTQKIKWEQNDDELKVELPEQKPCSYAYVLKIQ
ncbi:alpha-L-fucosidase [Mariniphaga anaerophila]|uniref:alpha-L-fucosidase n=1 Tax=Mariniphaga anaerophila TaxID=1484053 RepID=A0A1M5EMI9_9BACT|nr:alpha-L-fucosidase [Mariniphaga anaerophila]SHF80364.1 alpha-L-fucosidase [Mariniphaga anaerophila]